MAIFELVPITEALEKAGQVELVEVGEVKDEVQLPLESGGPAMRLDQVAARTPTARRQRPPGLVGEAPARPPHEDPAVEPPAAVRQEQPQAQARVAQPREAPPAQSPQPQEVPPAQPAPRQEQPPVNGPTERTQPQYVTDIPRLPPLSDGQPPARDGKDRRSGYGPANPRGNRPFRRGR